MPYRLNLPPGDSDGLGETTDGHHQTEGTVGTTEQKERERKLVRRVVDGLAGWLTFRQAGGATTLYSEYFLYPPIYEIASGRAWSVLAQEPIKGATASAPSRGAPSTLDFVFYESRGVPGNHGLVMMEVKYLRGKNATQNLSGLQDDFIKLRMVARDTLRNARRLSKCGSPAKWQIIVAQRGDYARLSKSSSQNFGSIATMLLKAVSVNTSEVIYRSVIETKLRSEFHWHVIAVGEKMWPSSSPQKS